MTGIFICFEGIQASGKTTQIDLLKERLEKQGKTVLVSKAYTSESRKAIEDFLKKINVRPDSEAAIFAFQALNAAQRDSINEALTQYDYVIADRWDETSRAFLEMNKGKHSFSDGFIDALTKAAFGGTEPDVTYLIDVKPQTAHDRYFAREKSHSRNEAGRSVDHFERASFHFRKAASARKWHKIDGEKDIQSIASEIYSLLPNVSKNAPSSRLPRPKHP